MSKLSERISAMYQHAENLNKIFPNLGIEGDMPAHFNLLARLKRLENKAHRMQEQECNKVLGEVYLTDEQSEKRDNAILDKLDKIIHFREVNIPVFINGDPRGYALKIKDDYVKEHDLQIYKDWGGYGIISPDFK